MPVSRGKLWLEKVLNATLNIWSGFGDVALEAAYLRHNHALVRRSRAWLGVACGVALLLLLLMQQIAPSAGGLTAYCLATLVAALALDRIAVNVT